MKFSHASPYKLQDSNLTYDTLQYQELMKNFENLIKTTQEKLNQNQFSLEQSCQCTLEEQLQELQQENEQLRDYIKKQCEIDHNTMKIMKESGNLINQQQITQLINEFAQKSEQQNHLIAELQDQLQGLQNQLHQEKNNHKSTCIKFEEEFTKYKNEKAFQNYKELEVNEKITKGFQELIDENQDYKQINKKLNKQIENQKIALNQAYLVMSRNKFPVMSERKHQQCQTDDDLFTKTEILKERLQNQVQSLDKFIITYIDKKLQRNKSANEVKFYTTLNNWIQQIKNETLIHKQTLHSVIDEKQQLCQKLKQTENQLEQNEEKYSNEQFQIQEHWKNEYLKNQQLLQQKIDLEQKTQEINAQLNQKIAESKQQSLQINSLQEQIEKLNLEVNSYDTQYKFIVENFENEKKDYLVLLDSEKQKAKAVQLQLELKNQELIEMLNKNEVLLNKDNSVNQVINQQLEQISLLNKTLSEKNKEIESLTLNEKQNEMSFEQLKLELHNLKNQEHKTNEASQSMKSAYELLQDENDQLQTYCKQLQQDIRDRNIQLSDVKNQLSELENQLYQNQVFDKSQLENTYMSSKIDDLESILKEKDQKIEEIEKLYHLTSYELRLLQDYQQSLENDVNSYKSKVAKLESELDISNMSKGGSFLQEESQIFQLQMKIKSLEDQIQQLTSFTTIDQKSQKVIQQNSPSIQVKILSGEISRLNQTISLLQMKVQDLQYFIEKMITANESNRLLATQILVQASQQGKILESNLNLNDGRKSETFQSGETFGFTVQSLQDCKQTTKSKKIVHDNKYL